MRATVIINPSAGRHSRRRPDATAAEALARVVLGDRGYEVAVARTAARGDATALAQRAVDGGATLVVAWGGDGTVNEVAGALSSTAVSLGIVPAGSGNGLATSLGLGPDPGEALRIAADGADRVIDAGEIQGRLFVNVAGLGLDAAVAARFAQRTSSRRGLAGYLGAACREFWWGRTWPVEVETGSERLRASVRMVAFANSPQYGNGALIAPAASLDDRLLDLVVVAAGSRIGDLWRARRLFDGSLPRDPGVQFRLVKEARVTGPAPLPLHADGEPLPPARRVDVRVRPAVLRVRVPAAHDAGVGGAAAGGSIRPRGGE